MEENPNDIAVLAIKPGVYDIAPDREEVEQGVTPKEVKQYEPNENAKNDTRKFI